MNTQQQLADGMTKIAARSAFCQIIRRGVLALKFDPEFVSGKKLSSQQVEARENALDGASRQLLQIDESYVAEGSASRRTPEQFA